MPNQSSTLIPVAADTLLHAVRNGRDSDLSAVWYKWTDSLGQRTDYYSGETLILDDCPLTDFVEVGTNYSPRTKEYLVFCVHPAARLRLYFGGTVRAADLVALCKKGATQLLGEHGMYEARTAQIVERKAFLCNTTTVSSVFLDHPATAGLTGRNIQNLWNEQTKTQILGRHQPTQNLIQNWITTGMAVKIQTDPTEIRRWMPKKRANEGEGEEGA